MSRRLPKNWQTLSLGALWLRLNDPRRLTTPDSVIEAIMYCVRARPGRTQRTRQPRTPRPLQSRRAGRNKPAHRHAGTESNIRT